MAPDSVRCSATKTDGSPCGTPPEFVDPRTGLCPSHQEGASERLSALGKKGAEATARKLRGGGLDPEELPPLRGPRDAERVLEVVIRAVATGRLGHNEGRTVVRGVREFLRAHEKGQVSERLDALMDALASWRKTGNPAPVLELVEGGRDA